MGPSKLSSLITSRPLPSPERHTQVSGWRRLMSDMEN